MAQHSPSQQPSKLLRWLELAESYSAVTRADAGIQYQTFWQNEEIEHNAESSEQICRDLHRTFTNGGNEMMNTDPQLEVLRRVLLCCDACMVDGYTQSMNFVVGMIMFQAVDVPEIKESDIHWLAMAIFNGLLPEYYNGDLLGSQIDSRVLSDLVWSHLPQVAQSLEDARVVLQVLAIEWLMTLFTSALPWRVAAHAWSAALTSGRSMLLAVCIALLDWCHKRIRPVDGDHSDLSPAGGMMKQLRKTLWECSELEIVGVVVEAEVINAGVGMVWLDDLSHQHRNSISAEVAQRMVRTQARKLQSVSSISRAQIEEIQTKLKHNAHRYTDQAGKRGVSRDGLRLLFDDLFTEGWSHTAHITNVLFDSLDHDGTGELEVVDILRALAFFKARTLQYFISEIFELFDADCTGGLKRDEVKRLFEWLYALNYTHPPTSAEINAIVESSFQNIDLDCDGVVDLEELTLACSHIPLITACFVRSHETLQLRATASTDSLSALNSSPLESVGELDDVSHWTHTLDVVCRSLQRAMCSCGCFVRSSACHLEEDRPLIDSGQPSGRNHEMGPLG